MADNHSRTCNPQVSVAPIAVLDTVPSNIILQRVGAKPTIVAQFMGRKIGLDVGLVTTIPWIVAVIGIYAVTTFSDRTGNRQGVVGGLYVLLAAALVGSLTLPPALGLVCLCVAAAAYCGATPLFWTMATGFMRGPGAACGIAIIGAVGNLGGFLAPSLKNWAEIAFGHPVAGMITMGACALLGSIMVFAVDIRKPQAMPPDFARKASLR